MALHNGHVGLCVPSTKERCSSNEMYAGAATCGSAPRARTLSSRQMEKKLRSE
eukprot:CAMPEP_0183719610 /NCGR_PEP_ID=MMETSP0737-20130205/12462_1 /TAXON_ID=385413 /ORGANISM="Thalassiosira miniscula, Strain CCMP1093" /LENGTH=52 /DNA_ID=CAMNT_0025949331 /DNA_START=739 /DNA_END=897 /DNA_ORIENTATION=+